MKTEYLCPVTGNLCPIGQNLDDLEKAVSRGPEDPYQAFEALKNLVLLKRNKGDCEGVFTETDETTKQVMAEHCGVDNVSEITRLASTVGAEFGMPIELYTGISIRNPNNS